MATKPHYKTYAIDLLQNRIKSKMVVSESGCWEWTKALHRDGYAMMWEGKTTKQAHRVSYEAFVGAIPPRLMVCHKCDNRKCVNPDHLFIGTCQDNVDDMVSKGRKPAGNNHWTSYKPECVARAFGESNQAAKLSNEQVAEILTGAMSPIQYAQKFGVTRNHIYRIRRGERRPKG